MNGTGNDDDDCIAVESTTLDGVIGGLGVTGKDGVDEATFVE